MSWGAKRGVEIFTRQDGELIALISDKWRLNYLQKELPDLTLDTLIAD